MILVYFLVDFWVDFLVDFEIAKLFVVSILLITAIPKSASKESGKITAKIE